MSHELGDRHGHISAETSRKEEEMEYKEVMGYNVTPAAQKVLGLQGGRSLRRRGDEVEVEMPHVGDWRVVEGLVILPSPPWAELLDIYRPFGVDEGWWVTADNIPLLMTRAEAATVAAEFLKELEKFL